MTQNASVPGSGTETLTVRPRIAALDVLRGVALCGILVANVQLIATSAPALDTPPLGGVQSWLGLPLFSLLFGIGFALLAESAAERARRPRLVLMRRLLVLLPVGLLHMLLWPGEILSSYAVVGLLVLLPSTWLPRWAVAGLAVVLLPTALIVAGGGPLMIAALFLTGSALARYGAVDRVERSTRGLILLGLGFAAVAVLAQWAQDQVQTVPGPAQPPSVLLLLVDLLQTGVYACALLLLLRTPLRPVLVAVAVGTYLTALLMVSTFRYWSFKEVAAARRRPVQTLLVVVLAVGIVARVPEAAVPARLDSLQLTRELLLRRELHARIQRGVDPVAAGVEGDAAAGVSGGWASQCSGTK